ILGRCEIRRRFPRASSGQWSIAIEQIGSGRALSRLKPAERHPHAPALPPEPPPARGLPAQRFDAAKESVHALAAALKQLEERFVAGLRHDPHLAGRLGFETVA